MIINDEFTVHKLNPAGFENAKYVAKQFDNLLERLKAICPPGRAFDTVKARLEEACFFAKKSLASFPANQLLD